jgi:hypothetical protein
MQYENPGEAYSPGLPEEFLRAAHRSAMKFPHIPFVEQSTFFNTDMSIMGTIARKAESR